MYSLVSLAAHLNAFVIFAAQGFSEWLPLNCYVDFAESRVLRANSYVSDTAMTPQSCTEFCAAGGYPFAGVEYSKECYCDYAIQDSGYVTWPYECQSPCTGGGDDVCGAQNRIYIYRNVNLPVPSTKETIGSWEYKGCFVDVVSSRTLGNSIQISGGTTAEKCTGACKSAGFAIAGLEYSRECWCDNFVHYPIRAHEESECQLACQGDHSEFCGGSERLTLYQDIEAPVINPRGCLSESKLSFNLLAVDKAGKSSVPISSLVVDHIRSDYDDRFSILTACANCMGVEGSLPIADFSLQLNTLRPRPAEFFPIPTVPFSVNEADSPVFLLSLPARTNIGYQGFCVMPNPLTPARMGYPLLSGNGRPDLWALCTNTTANGRLDVVWSPQLNHAHYNKDACQEVYLMLEYHY